MRSSQCLRAVALLLALFAGLYVTADAQSGIGDWGLGGQDSVLMQMGNEELGHDA